MDALATIAFEIQATVTGILVIALIVILQILDLQRAKQTHKLKMLELSNSLRSGEGRPSWSLKKYRLVSSFSLFLQFIFGLVVLALLSVWTLYLANTGYVASAVCSGITALVAILMPFIVWLSCRPKNHEVAKLLKDFENQTKIVTESEIKPEIQAPITTVTEIAEVKPALEQTELPIGAESVPTPKLAPVVQATPKAAFSGISEKIPEDSMLRRHYLTQIQSKKKTWVPERPTDSMLRRHYDSLMASQQQAVTKPKPEPAPQIEPIIPMAIAKSGEITVASRKSSHCSLPQDSMLRRHYLTVLRYQLESTLPPRPSDSMLKRHYDAWKNELINRKIDQCH